MFAVALVVGVVTTATLLATVAAGVLGLSLAGSGLAIHYLGV